jgi:hypothetical protein
MQICHTPGPWKAIMAYGYRIEAAGGKVVAKLPTHCPLTAENPANAYLIAAAPELLDVCQAVLAEIDNHSDIPDHDKQLLRDAIARATGQAAVGWMRSGRND